MPFKKGQSGNPNGRPKLPSFRDVCKEEHPELIALWWGKLEEKLESGDSKVLVWMGDQLNGKAPQRLEVTGADGGPLEHNVTGEFFDELAKRFFPKPEKSS